MNLLDALDASGLTGRGGAAFSTATKVRAAAEHRADLIVNACDGELGAAKDGWVVEHHLDDLVHGATLVASGRGRRVLFAAHRGSRTAGRLRAAGLDVLEAPHRYVSSEETSLISLAHGGLARPMTKRAPFVLGGRDSQGRRIRPTLVLNAETTWRIAQIAERGPAWFRAFGTAQEPGPRLVSIGGYIAAPQVLPTEAGAGLAGLLEAAGGLSRDVEAVLIGGLGGVFVTAEEARRATWTRESLAEFGGSIGPGVITVIDPRLCPLQTVAGMLAHAAGESAGQCGPCMFGLPAVAADFGEFAARPSRAGYDRLAHHLGLLPNRGACRFPDGVSRFAASALRVFARHADEHARGWCPQQNRSPQHVAAP